jgi:hypothetical protein
MAVERLFNSIEWSFGDVVRVMGRLGIIDERKLSVCLASSMYLEKRQFFTLTD